METHQLSPPCFENEIPGAIITKVLVHFFREYILLMIDNKPL